MSSSSYDIKLPNKLNLNFSQVNQWISNSNIRDIAQRFIQITKHYSYEQFKDVLENCIKECMETIKRFDNVYIYLFDEEKRINKKKSGYWVYKHLSQHINIPIYKENQKLNSNDILIIPDDASYSGSQLSNIIEDLDVRTNIFMLVPFISNVAIDIINYKYSKKIRNNPNLSIYFPYNKVILQPIYELMSNDEIKKIAYYINKNDLRQYPVYFDHKIADSYSSFPLLYTYGIVLNEHNRDILIKYKNKKELQAHQHELQAFPFLTSCENIINEEVIDPLDPKCPKPPYK